jgi:ribonuclease P protein component
MLARADRLTTGRDFSETIRRGRRAGARSIVVHLDRGDEAVQQPLRDEGGSPADDRPRAGFVVARSVGPAVTRNRVKRRLRHLVRGQLPALPTGSRLVVRALPPAAAASSEELEDDLRAALHRVQQPRRATAQRSPGGPPGGGT